MNKRKGRRYNTNAVVLCGLVFFVIAATVFCMVANGREVDREAKKAEAQQQARSAKEAEQKAAEEAAAKEEEERKESFTLQPGVAVGTTEVNEEEKVVYLTFDDGPSKNTERILDILEEYDAKATFFITGQQKDYRPMIKKAYDAGHTIGLHSYSHDYSKIYSSTDAFFEDLDKVGQVAEEQIGFVPCFIRFPGGASNTVSKKYTKGIMGELTEMAVEKGYQYYDWNVSSGDGAKATKEEIIKQSETDKYSHVMILFHDAATKDTTVEALPDVIKYYQDLGYEFRAVDRESLIFHHQINN